MIGRNRRVRLTAIAAFLFIAFVLYARSGGSDEEFEVFHPDAVGGGSVIRPKLEDIAPQAPPPPPEPAPEKEPVIAPEPALPKAPPVENKPPPPNKVEQKTTPSTTPTPDGTTPLSTPAVPATDLPPAPPPHHDYGYEDIEAGNALGRVEATYSAHPTAQKTHWRKFEEQYPVESTAQLPTGSPKPFPRIQREAQKLVANGADAERLAAVKAAATHAWGGYREMAFGMDEIRPVSGKSNNPFNGWGASLVDALDTLWIMGMEAEFEEALKAVEKIDFTWSPRSDIPLFETTIRYLGGLIAAYDVSGRKYRVLLDKAVELAEVLFSAFDTPNRMPQTYYRWTPSHASQPSRAGSRAVLAEIGTLSMEFTRLAQLTYEPKYYDAIARITDQLEEFQNRTRLPGMWPTSLDASGCGKPPQMIVRGPDYHAAQGVKNTQPFPDGSDRDMEAGAPVIPKQRPEMTETKPKIVDMPESNRNVDLDKDRLPHEPVDPGLGSNKAKRQLDLQHTEPIPVEKPSMDPADIPHRNQPSMAQQCIPQGLNSTSQSSQESFTLGGASDSLYEYLPKQHLLLGGLVDQYRTMYLDSAATAIENLLFKPMTPDERDILVSGNLKLSPNYSTPEAQREYIGRFTPEIEHLTCFAGGMFALGGVLFNKEEHVTIGSKLTDGCVWAYSVTATGIMPESAVLMPCDETWGDCPYNETAYWAELDPYEHTRTKVHEPVMQQAPPTHTASSDAAPAVSTPAAASTSAAAAAVEPAPAPALQAELQRDANLNKRQFGEYVPGPAQPQAQVLQSQAPAPAPPAPQPAQPQPAPAAHPPDQGASKPNQPNLVQMSGNRANNAHVPVYTPPVPLPHKEYVLQKIADERLPPAFVRINSRKYILRPEAIESVFYMYRITGDQYWRDAGWNMFTSIDRQTRALYGASAIDDVTKSAPELLDEMESFWLAETLKYFYLLFDEPSRWSLDDWVLNTEAHLFRRPQGGFIEKGGVGSGGAGKSESDRAPGWKARIKRAIFG